MSKEQTIQEVAEVTGLSVYTLRYYERIGLITDINRAENGHRRYTENDVSWITFLTYLRATDMSITDMQEYANLVRDGERTATIRKEMLLEHKKSIEAQINALEETLTIIDNKIALYQSQETSYKPMMAHQSS